MESSAEGGGGTRRRRSGSAPCGGGDRLLAASPPSGSGSAAPPPRPASGGSTTTRSISGGSISRITLPSPPSSGPRALVRVLSLGSSACSGRFNNSNNGSSGHQQDGISIVRVKSVDDGAGGGGQYPFPLIRQDPTFESVESGGHAAYSASSGSSASSSSDGSCCVADEDDIVEIGIGNNGKGTASKKLHKRQQQQKLQKQRGIPLGIPTGETNCSDEDSDEDKGHYRKSEPVPEKEPLTWTEEALCWIYLGTFAVFACVLRIFAGRFFGLDCEHLEAGLHSADDFLVPLSSQICVTASGKTVQTGGALFVDLPANMLGSFLMGLVSPVATGHHPLPWFNADHPLQRHWIFHLALRLGFCGALTTFASWNTQMVVMLEGTYADLGSQVAPALFGYLVGAACAVSSFVFGRHVYDWWRAVHPIIPGSGFNAAAAAATAVMVLDDDEERRASAASTSPLGQESGCKRCWERFAVFIGIRVSPFVLLAVFLGAFFEADFVQGIAFYRKMWLSSLVAPFGALLRWKLAKYNESKGYVKCLEWVPWGTLMANMIAVVISAIMEAVELHYLDPQDPGYEWLVAILPAIETGFAGSLSTVSTFVKEIVDMKSPGRQFIYCWGSLVLAMFVGLLCYAPIVRS